jgi:hypothetical protein
MGGDQTLSRRSQLTKESDRSVAVLWESRRVENFRGRLGS